MKRLCAEHGYQHGPRTGEWFHGCEQPPSAPDDYVIKVMPDTITDPQGFLDNYVARAEKIYYSLRRDFAAQYNSWMLAIYSDQWHPPEIEQWAHIQGEPGEVNMTFNQPEYHRLMYNFLQQRKFYHEHGGEPVWLEDVADQPYHKVITAAEPLEVPPVDLEMLWQNPEMMP